jgi:hypothetical protein
VTNEDRYGMTEKGNRMAANGCLVAFLETILKN